MAFPLTFAFFVSEGFADSGVVDGNHDDDVGSCFFILNK